MRKLLNFRNKSARLLRAKGDAARDRRDWSLAAALYETYLADPSFERDAPIWVQLGHARKESGDYEEAMSAYQRALELAPAVADTHLQIGHLHKKMGAVDAAEASYAKALEVDANLEHARQELAGTPVKTLNGAGTNVSIDLGSADPGYLLARADAARDGRHWSEAASYYTAYLDLRGDQEEEWPLWVQLGHARKEAGNGDGAVQAYRRAIELAPNVADTHLHLGHVYKTMGALEAAMASFTEAVRHDSQIGDAYQEIQSLASLVTTEAIVVAESEAVGRPHLAHPLPLTPEQVVFDPAFPSIYCGLFRRFGVQ